MTLLEVLLATALMAVVVSAASSWIAAQARSSRSAQQRLAALAALAASVRAIDDDLVGGVGLGSWRVDTDGALVGETLHVAPGDPVGIHTVRWRFADGALGRDSGGTTRIASWRLGDGRFAEDGHGSALTVIARLSAGGGEVAVGLRTGRGP